jgi:hypothetical protein
MASNISPVLSKELLKFHMLTLGIYSGRFVATANSQNLLHKLFSSGIFAFLNIWTPGHYINIYSPPPWIEKIVAEVFCP